jgi:predicted DNA-binding transcriptional regulator AlpA
VPRPGDGSQRSGGALPSACFRGLLLGKVQALLGPGCGGAGGDYLTRQQRATTGGSLPANGLWNEVEVAERLGIQVSTLRKRRLQRRPPAWIKVGRSVRYEPADVEQFVAAQRVEPGRVR